ncbi:secreted nucleic acid binding protein [Methylocaldum marinum]|jgi:ribosomal protein L7/L12|uniref:Secreted nucleic acid binding protein n=1 Tax=Methylocaldum marinum TaxID=1432792 RepID=A0A250KY15_9GAMM|nr:hypothetical protein [Methylocaldum marinum]BBA36416.1 secreted nucleic acid binding protein [Methylocaldum marinum]
MSFAELIICVALASALVTVATLILNRRKIPNIKTDEDVLELLSAGKRIKAIKAYRQLHKSSLKVAKAFIDSHLQTEK